MSVDAPDCGGCEMMGFIFIDGGLLSCGQFAVFDIALAGAYCMPFEEVSSFAFGGIVDNVMSFLAGAVEQFVIICRVVDE